MGTKINPGKFDCFANALPDEPMFVLLARDASASKLVTDWATIRKKEIEEGRRPLADMAMIEEALACARAMTEWRADNWPRRKGEVPKDDPAENLQKSSLEGRRRLGGMR